MELYTKDEYYRCISIIVNITANKLLHLLNTVIPEHKKGGY
jgi:hypothetical protein